MGLVARAIEKSGISTMAFGLSLNHLESIRPPRAIFTKWPFGNPLGEPGNIAQQNTMIHHALRIIKSSVDPGEVIIPEYPWRRHIYTEPSFEDL